MAVVTVNPQIKLTSVSIGADEYTTAITDCRFDPSQSAISFTDVAGTVHNIAGQSGYVANVTFAQDWSDEDSLSHYLFEHDGEQATLTVVLPGGTWMATVTLAAPSIGGQGNVLHDSTLTLQVDGKPVFTAAS